jgi:acyl-CoA synthetase (AMP-forming)/AMP-acid ligase II
MLAYWPADQSSLVLDITVGDMLREAAAAAPSVTALVAGTADPGDRRRWTYSELLEQSERAARALLGRFEPSPLARRGDDAVFVDAAVDRRPGHAQRAGRADLVA